MSTRNADLFEQIADQIDMNPDTYDQTTWCDTDTRGPECGTTACIAGWAVLLSASKEDLEAAWAKHATRYVDGDAHRIDGTRLLYTLAGGRAPSTAAAELLGLDIREAEVLFDGCWYPQDGESVADTLRKFGKGDPIVTPDQYGFDDDDDNEDEPHAWACACPECCHG